MALEALAAALGAQLLERKYALSLLLVLPLSLLHRQIPRHWPGECERACV